MKAEDMNDTYLYALAGLLHDIGKFGQRADVSVKKSEELDDQSRKMAEQICNWSQNGYYTHQHVLWTNNFLEAHKTIFEHAKLYGDGINNMFNLAAYHHKPKTFEQAIITMADYWSSGIDRNSEKTLEKNPTYGKDRFRSTPLVSLFNELSTGQKATGIEQEKYGYSLQKNGITNSIFPIETISINLKADYPDLWKEFNAEVSKIKTTDARNLIFTLYYLLKKYTWYIPASTMDYPNCSLFEHLKTTGAFAYCLSEYFKENPSSYQYETGKRIQLKDDHYPVLMICGDLSGIQSFIYNISNKSAMKGLKGRSFYVQLLCDTICDELLEACNATIINQVYVAGGKFYLLLPNTESVKEAIKQYEKRIQQRLWDDFSGKININFGIVEFGMIVLKSELKVVSPGIVGQFDVGQLWGMVAEETSKKKKVRFNTIIEQNFEKMFNPFGQGGDVQVCGVTGEELNSNTEESLERKYREQGTDISEDTIVSKVVHDQIEIGSQLYNAQYLIKLNEHSKNGYQVGLNTRWDFVTDAEHAHSIKQWINIQFEDYPQLFPDRAIETNIGLGFKFYGGIPMVANGKKVATLEEICSITNPEVQEGTETAKLGVLRMDVDNLGQLFMKGFEKKGSSFSKLATLSALLEQFFSGYLNTIKNQEKYKQHINIIYSGGDDVFAVGRWDLLIDFTIELRNGFTKFVCGRNDITISGGLVIVSHNYPIAKAAEASGDAERMAKDFDYGGADKNAITLFGVPLHWESEMPFVQCCKNDLVQWIGHDKYISKGFLMKMFDYYNLYLPTEPEKEKKLDWQWQAAYTIARFAKEAQSDNKREIYNHFKNLLFSKSYKNQFFGIRFEAFIVACRWAELELKQNKL